MTKKKTRGRNYAQRSIAKIFGTSIMVSGPLAARFSQTLDPGDLNGNFSTHAAIRVNQQKTNRIGYVPFEHKRGEVFVESMQRHKKRVISLAEEITHKHKELAGRIHAYDNIRYSSFILNHTR